MDLNPKQPRQSFGLQFQYGAGMSLAICVGALLLGACVSDAGTPPSGSNSKQSLEASLPATAVTGEVPRYLLDAIIQDLVSKENLPREEIEVERAESVIWPDGSLGCPTPGEMYTQALVPGYWVVLRHAGEQYDYRASSRGSFRHCSNRLKSKLPAG